MALVVHAVPVHEVMYTRQSLHSQHGAGMVKLTYDMCTT